MLGVYVHIPFCQSRCRYCDFFSTTLLGRREEYVRALLAEIGPEPYQPDTIYLGGGTPSLLDTDAILQILSAIGTRNAREVTIEVNPGDVTADKASKWIAAGVNRVSMGIQSFQDELLRIIGRRHTAGEARNAITILREAGIRNLSIDLMYGLPRQTEAMWQADIAEAIQTGAEHVSCYCLSYEEGTPLWQARERGEIQETDEETENSMYDYLCDALRRAGYEHYEVSNFARPHFRAVHNSNYWNDTPYIGFGAGAHSYDGKRRFWNPSDLNTYIRAALARDLLREEEVLTDEQKHMERIMLCLRTREGVAADILDTKGIAKAEQLTAENLLRKQNEHYIATQAGLHILNRITEQLI